MKIFLDTIDCEKIKKYSEITEIYGITTNPTLAKRFNMSDDIDMIKKIANVIGIKKEIHVEAFGKTVNEIINNVDRIDKKCKKYNLVYKIPFSYAGVEASKIIVKRGKKTNLHLIYSFNQAFLASNIQSTYICPLIGRLDDVGHDAIKNISEIKKSFDLNNSKTRIMGSSIRTTQHVKKCYEVGIFAATIPLNVFESLFWHPLTNHGYDLFESDFKALKNVGKLNINNNLIVDEKTSLSRVVSILAINKGGAVAITKNNKLTGIFTTGDLNRYVKKNSKIKHDIKISNLMSKNPIKLHHDQKVSDAVELVKKTNLGQFIVVNNTKVLGILDAKDLV